WLADIDAAQSVADVQRIVRRLHELGVAAPFGMTGAYENSAPTHFVANVVAGALGMGDRDGYTKPEARFVELREKYRAHLARVLELAGVPVPRAREAAGA